MAELNTIALCLAGFVAALEMIAIIAQETGGRFR